MDAFALQSVLPGIRDELAGRPVTKVELAGKFGVLLRFGGTKRLLWLSAHPELSRIGLVDAPPTGYEPRPAGDNLSEPLIRSRLIDLEQETSGRVVTLRLENEDARHKAPTVVAELIPRFANVILVGNDGRILWCKREFTGDRPRQITPGRPYAYPAADPGVRFPELDAETLGRRLDEGEGPLHRRVPRGWGGGAKGFARVLEESAAADDEDFQARLLALASAAAEPAPHLAHPDGGGDPVLFPAHPGEIPGWQLGKEADANATVDVFYRAREESETADTLLADLRRVLVRRRARAAKTLNQVERRLEEADREAEYRAQAELLTAHMAQMRRGMKSVRLPAFDGSGEVEIPLDPKMDGQRNVEALFKRARRLARGREEMETQQAIQQSELREMDTAIERLEPPPSPETLQELARSYAPALLQARPGSAAASASRRPAETERTTTLPEGFSPRVYFLPGGWEVWVGRNAKQNDELTHKRASQKDIWFHARGCQGSHAVLRISSGKGEPPREIVERAAAIAAFHSKSKNSHLVPVAYTEKRYVRRPRGAPAGTAVMMREKVVMVEPGVPAEGGE